MQQNVIDANAKVDLVRKLLSNYVNSMGSINTSMHEFREAFAEIYPPSAPEFHYHFSTLARTAIMEDARRGRRTYPIGGTMGPNYDPMVGNPIILPGKAIFHNSKESFQRALDRVYNAGRIASQPEDQATENTRSTSSQKISGSLGKRRMDEEPRSGSFKIEEKESGNLLDRVAPLQEGKSNLDSYIPLLGNPNLRPHPRFSPPHDTYTRHVEFVKNTSVNRGNSNTPSGTPPSSPEPRSKKTRRSSPSRSRSAHPYQEEHARVDVKPNSTKPSHTRDSRPRDESNQTHRRHTDYDQSRPRTRVSHQEGRRTRNISRQRPHESSDSEENSSEGLSSHSSSEYRAVSPVQNSQINFVAKVKQSYEFEAVARDKNLENYTKAAKKIQKNVVKHLSDIKQAVNAFNVCGAKPVDFPADLTRDLLEYNFINTEIIYAHNIERKSKTKVYDSDEKSSQVRKIKPKKIEHFGHWQKVMETLQAAYMGAFPSVKDQFIAYFDDLLSLTRGFSETAEWDKI